MKYSFEKVLVELSADYIPIPIGQEEELKNKEGKIEVEDKPEEA